MRGQPAISANVYLKSSSIKVLVVMELTIKNVDEIKRDRLSKPRNLLACCYVLCVRFPLNVKNVMYYVQSYYRKVDLI